MTPKKLLSASLAVVMALSSMTALASCQKESGPVKEKRTNVYGAVELQLPEGINYINQLAYANGNAYLTFYRDYTITYNSIGEEVERRSGYIWEEAEEVVDEDMAVPYAAGIEMPVEEVVEEDVPVEDEGIVDMDGDGIIDGFETSGKKPDQGDMSDEEYYETTGKLPVGWYYNYESIQVLCRVPLDGSPATEVPINLNDTEYGYMNNLKVAPDGRVLATTSEWSYDEETGVSMNEYYLLELDSSTGAIANVNSLNEAFVEAGADVNNFYVNTLLPAADGSYYVSSDNIILHLSQDFRILENVSLSSGWISTMVVVGDKLLVSYYDQSQNCKILENGQLVDIQSENLKDVFSNYYGVIGSDAGAIYYRLDSGIFKYDFETDTTGEILNFINSDIDTTSGTNMCLMEDGRILFAYTDWNSEESNTTLQVLTKIPDEELEEEIIVKVGTVYSDYNLTKAIITYNKQNTGIRIAVQSYEQYNNEENQWNGAVQQLNNDIITGKLPDIIYLNSELPAESYFQKGIFVDLNKYIDDPEVGLNRNEFMANVLEANSVDGKLYSMIFNFTLGTLVAKTKFVGTEEGWTFDEMMNCINSMPEGMKAFFDMGRKSIVTSLFRNSLGSFVDWENGTNNFDSPGFINLIKYLSTCSELGYWEEYYESMGDNYVYDEDKEREMQEVYQLRFYNDSSLFSLTSIGSFTDFLYQRNTFASKDIIAIGYPTDIEGANGSVIIPSMEMAISASSKVKDQAWEILKFFMTEKSLNDATYRFSIYKERNEENMAKASENFYYYESSEDDLAWYRDYGYSEEYITYTRESNQPYDQAAVDYVMELIGGAKEIQRTDTDLVDIIEEELSVFFSGTRSAEETAKIIASRARIYISENS